MRWFAGIAGLNGLKFTWRILVIWLGYGGTAKAPMGYVIIARRRVFWILGVLYLEDWKLGSRMPQF